jgi:succinate dehydrogenase / fumarate reductase cytochrome b subunit
LSVQYHYIARRLHSLSGLIPVGVFLLVHLFINSFVFKGPEAYNQAVKLLNSSPITPWLEVFLIGIPIAYHGFYGLWVTYVCKTNIFRYQYFRNWMFYFQRVTAVITLIFVLWHVYVLRIARIFTGTEMTYDIFHQWASNPTYFVIYIICLLAALFHFANGLWTFAFSWGITIGPESRKIWTYICVLIFVVLGITGINILTAFK